MKVLRPIDGSIRHDAWHDDGRSHSHGPRRAHRSVVLPAALVVAAAAVALLVGRDGSAGWRCARVVAVAGVAIAGCWVLRRAGAVGRGLVAVAAGLLATAVGVGIALPTVSKLGFTAVSLAGVACLAAGLVLVVGGAVTPLRAARSWWRIPIVVGLLVATYTIVFVLGVADRGDERAPDGPRP